MAASIKIDPLNGENYDTWKIHMRAILKKNDLWDYVTGDIPRPEFGTTEVMTRWRKLDGKAESDILLTISPSELIALDGIETSKGIWDELKLLYQSSGPTRKASLLKKLVLTRMQEEDDLKKHLGELFDTVKKLKEINFVAIDELLAILLLYSLPDSFSMLRTAMESQDELPSTEILRIKIIENYEGRKSRDVNTDQGAMYLKKEQGTRTQTSENQKSDNHHHSDGRRYRNKVKCYRCGRVGHIARDCRSKYPVNKSKQSAKQLDDQDCEYKNKQEIKKNALLINFYYFF